MNNQCKVCGYPEMPYPPADYNICPCCGIEYAVDDAFESHAQLRDEWLRAGARWFSQRAPFLKPMNWNAWDQLDFAGLSYAIPRPPSIVQNTFRQLSLARPLRVIWRPRELVWV